eukprot:850262_1
MIPVYLKQFKHYHFVLNEEEPKANVLVRSESLTPTDIVVAFRYFKDDKQCYLYFRFPSINYFMQHVFLKLKPKHHKFFAVFTSSKRCLYLDIDCYVSNECDIDFMEHEILYNILKFIQREYKSIIMRDLYVWTA